jgi:hypothetical protein
LHFPASVSPALAVVGELNIRKASAEPAKQKLNKANAGRGLAFIFRDLPALARRAPPHTRRDELSNSWSTLRLAALAKPITGKFHAAPDPLWSEHEVNGTAELVWN